MAVQRTFIAVLTGLTLLAGCASSNNGGASDTVQKIVTWGPWVATAYLVLDPLSPNWTIEEARLPDNHYHLTLRMKRYYAGGAGEARVIFHRRAKELMRASGFDNYEVLDYQEGLESSIIGGQRFASGVIRLSR